jgi:hypothetical protein
LVIIIYALSTLIGFILDGMHHFFYEELNDIKFPKDFLTLNVPKPDEHYLKAATSKHKAIINNEQLEIYRYFVDEDFWYPYEAYANISIAMAPGILLLAIWLTLNLLTHFSLIVLIGSILIFFIYIFVFLIMIFEAKHTFVLMDNEEHQYLKAKGTLEE